MCPYRFQYPWTFLHMENISEQKKAESAAFWDKTEEKLKKYGMKALKSLDKSKKSRKRKEPFEQTIGDNRKMQTPSQISADVRVL